MSNTFRKAYRDLTADEVRAIESLKDAAEDIEAQIDAVLGKGPGLPEGRGRALALAKTKLEEAVMWAVRGISA